jgi:hypothetical protein
MNNPNTDFDTPWKDVLEIYFEDFGLFWFLCGNEVYTDRISAK